MQKSITSTELKSVSAEAFDGFHWNTVKAIVSVPILHRDSFLTPAIRKGGVGVTDIKD